LFSDSGSRILWAGTTYTSVADFSAGSGQCANCPTEADPLYLNADYALNSDSPAVNKGESHAIYDYFFSRYGVSINRDQAGTLRPQKDEWDIGAFEYDEDAPPTPAPPSPAPPDNNPDSNDSDDSSGGCFLSLAGCP
jgi:hypothetical protein